MSAPALLHRPIFGPDFGAGDFALATVTGIERGLHTIKYMVINPRSGAIVAAGKSKAETLAAARRVVRATDALLPRGEAANDAGPSQCDFWPEELEAVRGAMPVAKKKVSRRRRAVFERSGGRCHYCEATLSMDGKWHVEHQIPRALNGTDSADNLVASCVACNLRKSDRTAIEFVVLSASGGWDSA